LISWLLSPHADQISLDNEPRRASRFCQGVAGNRQDSKLDPVARSAGDLYVVPSQNEVFAASCQFEKTAEFAGDKSGDVLTIWQRIRFTSASF
jgi:hypothetical protein